MNIASTFKVITHRQARSESSSAVFPSDPERLSPPPVPYQAAYESAEQEGTHTERALIETMTRIQEETHADGRRAPRSAHAKSHGILCGEMRVPGDLPPHLSQGLFSSPGVYPLVMRFSTNPGDLLDDSVSTPRGLAVKVIGIPGARLRGSEADVTQDFVMVNRPAFPEQDGESFLSSLELLAATANGAPALQNVLPAALRGAESLTEAAGGQSPALIHFGGRLETHILGETFYSATPYLYGKYMAKFSIAPVSSELLALREAPLDLQGKPNGLRDAVIAFFAQHGADWELRVQLCVDVERMPIENPKVVWPESLSAYIPIARIVVPAQRAWGEARARAIDEGYSFSPWHGLAAHRPLGSINRLRKCAYEASRAFRMARNGSPTEEPRSLQHLPD